MKQKTLYFLRGLLMQFQCVRSWGLELDISLMCHFTAMLNTFPAAAMAMSIVTATGG